MSHGRGQVKFKDTIKYFEFNGTENICKPKLYDTYDEMIKNWRKTDALVEEKVANSNKRPFFKRIFQRNKTNRCNHNEEFVYIYTDYGDGFYWSGTACKKCNRILDGKEPFELPYEKRLIKKGIPTWAEDYRNYDND